MPVSLFALLVLAASLNITAEAQNNQAMAPTTEETWSAACASKIEHPLYPAAALDAGLAGLVSAGFTINPSGKAAALAMTGPDSLASAVRTAVSGTTFPQPCAGRRLKVDFSFQYEPQLPIQHHVSVCFSHPPSKFSVIAKRIEMVCSFYTYAGPLVAAGRIASNHGLPELLADPTAYDGRQVALLGKWADSHFDGVWLSEDRCESRLITDGYEWPNEVWIRNDNSAPTPPKGLLVLDSHAAGRETRISAPHDLPRVGGDRILRQGWRGHTAGEAALGRNLRADRSPQATASPEQADERLGKRIWANELCPGPDHCQARKHLLPSGQRVEMSVAPPFVSEKWEVGDKWR
jgi:hypothetical protein